MAEGMNLVILAGNIGADPELRFTQGGTAVLNMRIAVNESYLDKDKVRRERTEWASIVVWGKRGEALAKIIAKGSFVVVHGSLRTSSYDDREGQKRYKTEVVANNVILGGRAPNRGDGGQDGAQGGQQGGDDFGPGNNSGPPQGGGTDDDLPY